MPFQQAVFLPAERLGKQISAQPSFCGVFYLSEFEIYTQTEPASVTLILWTSCYTYHTVVSCDAYGTLESILFGGHYLKYAYPSSVPISTHNERGH